MQSGIKLSPSTLNLFLECPKCFWLELEGGVHRPRGIFPSLPGGMDGVIKTYFDKYRAVNKVPPEIEGKTEGVLMADQDLLNKWRSWRTGLVYRDPENGAALSGAIDDLMVDPKKQLYIPFDYKTRGYALKADSSSFYQNQLNCYGLLLQENGLPIAGFGYLCYYIPKEVSEGGMVEFDVIPKKMDIDPEAARKVFRDAVKLLNGAMPKSHSNCEYCMWADDFIND